MQGRESFTRCVRRGEEDSGWTNGDGGKGVGAGKVREDDPRNGGLVDGLRPALGGRGGTGIKGMLPEGDTGAVLCMLGWEVRGQLAYRATWCASAGEWRVLVRGKEAEDRKCQEVE